MNLVQKQHKFAVMVSKLIIYADSIGLVISGGDWYRDARCNYGHPRSLHRLRLAFDINLFNAAGTYMVDKESHRPLGEYWERMGGTWGGHFDDPNHYSLEHDGMK